METRQYLTNAFGALVADKFEALCAARDAANAACDVDSSLENEIRRERAQSELSGFNMALETIASERAAANLAAGLDAINVMRDSDV